MRTGAKFKHTNLLKRTRYRAAFKAAEFYGKIKWPFSFENVFVICSPTPEWVNASNKVINRMEKLDRYLKGDDE